MKAKPTLPKTGITFLALWALTTLYIALFPTRHYTPDAVNNLVFIEEANRFELWHAQHLLAQWPGYWTYQLAGGALRAWEAMRIAHAVLAGATVSLVYAAVQALTQSQRIAVVSGLFLWFSYGFWHYHSDPDVYSAGYATVALLMFAYVRYLSLPTSRRAVALGSAGALAILMHQLNVELAALIGLSLFFFVPPAGRGMMHHAPTNRVTGSISREGNSEQVQTLRRHALIYALVGTLVPLAVYLIGWKSAGEYLLERGGIFPPFLEWALGYFGKAQAGEATWGVSLGVSTIPTALYTFLLSWVLPPPLDSASVGEKLLLALLSVGCLILFVHMAFALRRLPMPQRLGAWVCGLTLLANGISGWWWQAGNVKFYLFMQIPLVVLAALYARQALTGWQRRLRTLALGSVMSVVIGFHLVSTLPYETRGGVFSVADLAGETPVVVWFERPAHVDMFRSISSHTGHALPGFFCESLPALSRERTWWVVNDATGCPALGNAAPIGRFQADRSRAMWAIYEVVGE